MAALESLQHKPPNYCFIVCLSVETYSPWFIVFLVLGILVCAVNRLFLNAEKFLLSRDWVVVLSDGETLSSRSQWPLAYAALIIQISGLRLQRHSDSTGPADECHLSHSHRGIRILQFVIHR